ncbi:MAG TPA: carbamoyltransferase [Aggregatilineales bacterium]|nr:carbamoyltransferase [Anaerolineales bacterium]HRE48706.1 carbamoyltransferase [Aggregatilineales bacterium]
MYILGLSFYYHDSAAALIKDGELVAASMEERFSRVKNDNTFPEQAIAFCLRKAQITAADLDYVVFYEKPFVKFERILMTVLSTFPRSRDVWKEAMAVWLPEKLWVKTKLQQHLRVPAGKILFSDHHMSHAASAFYCSPFEEAAVITLDGVGEWTTTTTGRAKANWDGKGQNEIILNEEQRFPHSLGLLYSAFTAFLGFKVNEGEYKVMGMAPYGEPRFVDKVRKLIDLGSDGSFHLNMDYFKFHRSATETYNQKFTDLFGVQRTPSDDFFTMLTNPERAGEKEAMALNQYYADVAASVQAVTEEAILNIARHLHAQTGLKKLVMAGGVALNSVANFKVLHETPFEEVYIQPAAGDDGGALGAALWAYHSVLNMPRKMVMKDAYWGEEYSDAEIETFLKENGIAYEKIEDDTKLTTMVAEAITKGEVIGWHQGRFEWGPRALGNRSILADPRRSEMKNVVNTKIKYREPFRPFAPVVLAERATDFFEFPDVASHYPPRFMLMVSPVKPDKYEVIPATTHAGGTGRLQTVDRQTNAKYYDVIKTFGEITGVPVLLNTSFNLRGEPIVNTPANSFNTFSKSGLDRLVVGPYMVRK